MIGFEIPVSHVDYIKVRGSVAGILKAKSPIMIILEWGVLKARSSITIISGQRVLSQKAQQPRGLIDEAAVVSSDEGEQMKYKP